MAKNETGDERPGLRVGDRIIMRFRGTLPFEAVVTSVDPKERGPVRHCPAFIYSGISHVGRLLREDDDGTRG